MMGLARAWFRSQILSASGSAKRPKPIAPEVLVEQHTGGKTENEARPYQQENVPWSDEHGKYCPHQKPQGSNSHMSDVVPVHLGSPLSPVAHPVLRAFFLCRVQHQFHLWDSCQNFLEPGMGALGTVRHPEDGTGRSLVVNDRLAPLENEGLAEAAEKPPGILNAIDPHSAAVSQGTNPHPEDVHRWGTFPRLAAGERSATGDFCFPVRSFTDGNGFPLRPSYRSARRNQKARPPVLWYAPGAVVPGGTVARTPKEPFLPVLFQPRRSIIMRTNTPIACRNRLVRRGYLDERKSSTAG
jgi:hypothetical protein